MVDDLAIACDPEKITVLFSENPDLVSYIYIYVKQNEKYP